MSEEEKLSIELLIKQLQEHNQKDFPQFIDKEFENIANNKIKNYPIKHWLVYPLTRSIRMWSNPFSSFGWPNEMPDIGLSKEDRLSAAKGDSSILISKAIEFPMHASSKALNAFYRLILMMLFILSIIIIYYNRKNTYLFPISLITISYILSRTIFFSFNSNFETRYMVTTIPFIELLVILTFIPIIYKMK